MAPHGSKLATARPMSMAYYLQACGRGDIDVVSLYNPGYLPQDGDFIVLEPARRFFETQRFFDVLGSSRMSRKEIRVGPVLGSTIYRFDASSEAARLLEEDSTLSQLHEVPFSFNGEAQGINSMNTSRGVTSQLSRRRTQ